MVVGIAKMSPPGEEVIVAVRAEALATAPERAGCPVALWYFVYVARGDLMNCPVANVSDLEARVLVEATLHRDVPLPGIGRGVGRVLATGRGTRKTSDRGQRGTVQGAGDVACAERKWGIGGENVRSSADFIALEKLAEAGTNRGFSIAKQVISDSEARSNQVIILVCEVLVWPACARTQSLARKWRWPCRTDPFQEPPTTRCRRRLPVCSGRRG